MQLTHRLWGWISRPAPRTRVLLVCSANVCRSPLAEHVLRACAERASAPTGSGDATRSSGVAVHVESAGVHAPRRAEPFDARALDTLRRRGYLPKNSRSRALAAPDFERFDLLLAMDSDVLAAMTQMCPPPHAHKLHRFLDYAPGLAGQDVPDPYWGDLRGFEHVLDLCEAASVGLLDALSRAAVAEPTHREMPAGPVR